VNVEPSVAGPQAAPAVVSEPAPSAAPAVFDASQRELLHAMLNCIIPARAELPGAGDLAVGASIERTLSTSAALKRLFLDGLAHVAIVAQQQTALEFRELDPAQQTHVLQVVEQHVPAFFVALVEHTYRGYYTSPSVVRVLGSGPPQPIGHALPTFDHAMLAQQRRRTPFWRRAD
jgi:Gluconate 2-dehydrogenase subunit 3